MSAQTTEKTLPRFYNAYWAAGLWEKKSQVEVARVRAAEKERVSREVQRVGEGLYA